MFLQMGWGGGWRKKSVEEVNHLNLVGASALYMRQPATWSLTAERQPSWSEGDLWALQHKDQL